MAVTTRAATTRLLENCSDRKSWDRSQPAPPTVRARARMNPRIRDIRMGSYRSKQNPAVRALGTTATSLATA